MAFENEEKKLHDALVSCKVPDIAKAVDEAHAAGSTASETPCPRSVSFSRGENCSCPTS